METNSKMSYRKITVDERTTQVQPSHITEKIRHSVSA